MGQKRLASDLDLQDRDVFWMLMIFRLMMKRPMRTMFRNY